MELYSNLAEAVHLDTAQLAWQASPMAGVERRMLDRKGAERARATTIVRYQPKSYFSAHTHVGGEEFLVLDGVFSDQYGDFPAGTYVRNPVGSAHAPHTEGGATILVKLCQMHPEDQRFVRINWRDQSLWQQEAGSKIRHLPLHSFGQERVDMLACDGVGVTAVQPNDGGAEYFLLAGNAEIGGYQLGAGHWLRLPAGLDHAVALQKGALLYRKRGHLVGQTSFGLDG